MRGRGARQRHHHRAPRLNWTGLVVALVIGATTMVVGIWLLKGFANPLPPPPPAGEMRRVNLRYRCSICGVELRVTVAPDEDPAPPRHCMEEMDLVAPVD